MWSDMTPREQSALTAVNVLGWSGGEEEMYWPNREWVWRDRSGLRVECQGELVSDPAFARLAEQEIARRGLQDEYANALAALKPDSDWITGERWWLATATAEQRCHAACRAMGVEV